MVHKTFLHMFHMQGKSHHHRHHFKHVSAHCKTVERSIHIVAIVLSHSLSLMVMAVSSLVRIFGECSTIHSLPSLIFFFLKWRSACVH